MTRNTEGSHTTVFDTPALQPLPGDLRQSPVINILTSFLANCGGLMDILSGHGATATGPYSDIPMKIKNFAGSLRKHDSFKNPSTREILAIVDRFVNLNYFQNIDKIRDYIIIAAKACYRTLTRTQKKTNTMHRRYFPAVNPLQKSASQFIRP